MKKTRKEAEELKNKIWGIYKVVDSALLADSDTIKINEERLIGKMELLKAEIIKNR